MRVLNQHKGFEINGMTIVVYVICDANLADGMPSDPIRRRETNTAAPVKLPPVTSYFYLKLSMNQQRW